MTNLDQMLALAREAMARAYVPYSDFPVGAVVRASSGVLYSGCNVESSAYPQGCCAEASAIGAMILGGDRRIVEVVVMARGHPLCTPCGGCRQRLAEFAAGDVPVHVCDPAGVSRTFTLDELLPHPFGLSLERAAGG